MGDEEVKRWMEKADSDFSAAENSFKSGDYGWASFQVQQAIEKAFKALLIKRSGKFPRTHDLIELSKLVDASNKVIENCAKINPSYLETRYPDLSGGYTNVDAKNFIEIGRVVLKWIEENL